MIKLWLCVCIAVCAIFGSSVDAQVSSACDSYLMRDEASYRSTAHMGVAGFIAVPSLSRCLDVCRIVTVSVQVQKSRGGVSHAYFCG